MYELYFLFAYHDDEPCRIPDRNSLYAQLGWRAKFTSSEIIELIIASPDESRPPRFSTTSTVTAHKLSFRADHTRINNIIITFLYRKSISARRPPGGNYSVSGILDAEPTWLRNSEGMCRDGCDVTLIWDYRLYDSRKKVKRNLREFPHLARRKKLGVCRERFFFFFFFAKALRLIAFRDYLALAWHAFFRTSLTLQFIKNY